MLLPSLLLLLFNCQMMLVINSGLCVFHFVLNGDVKLQIPDFIIHEMDSKNVPPDAGSDED